MVVYKSVAPAHERLTRKDNESLEVQDQPEKQLIIVFK